MTYILDLFGNERILSASVRGVQLDLLDAAADQAALENDRPRSQERAELVAGSMGSTREPFRVPMLACVNGDGPAVTVITGDAPVPLCARCAAKV